jgi:asparagine synthase (glutamine-hydrolysing)
MKDKLPPAILTRSKAGFDIPSHEWFRGPLKPMLIETLRAGIAEYRDLFNGAAIESLMEKHFERKVNVGYHLWGLLILFLWMKKWRIQPASSGAPKTVPPATAGSSI